MLNSNSLQKVSNIYCMFDNFSNLLAEKKSVCLFSVSADIEVFRRELQLKINWKVLGFCVLHAWPQFSRTFPVELFAFELSICWLKLNGKTLHSGKWKVSIFSPRKFARGAWRRSKKKNASLLDYTRKFSWMPECCAKKIIFYTRKVVSI